MFTQLTVPGFHFPLLACDIDDIDVDLISWRNPNANNTTHPHLNYDDYNLIFDVPYDGQKRSKSVVSSSMKSKEQEHTNHVFSITKQWRPQWAENEQKEEVE